jgi:hypothetical protein
VRLFTGVVPRTLFVAAMCVASNGCDEKLSSVTGPTPNLAPNIASIQAEIFTSSDSSGRTSCITCHTNVGRTPAAGLNLAGDATRALVNVPSVQKSGSVLVIPGDPENSYLIQKIKGAGGITGLRMPRNGPPFLTDGQVLVIERWIQLGANQ